MRASLHRVIQNQMAGLSSAARAADIIDDPYTTGLAEGYREALDTLENANTFEEVFIAGRRLKLRMTAIASSARCQAGIPPLEHAPCDKTDFVDGDYCSPEHINRVIGQRDSMRYAVNCVQDIFTL